MTAFLNLAISSLDKPTSLIPFFVKDAFDVTGRTVMANKEGGKHEAREKFIEEFGTSLFWIGGIPAFRALSNKIFKNKIDSDIHFKRINTNGIQSYYADKLEQSVLENGQSVKKSVFGAEDLKDVVLNGSKNAEIKEKLLKSGFIPNVSKGKYKIFHIGTTVAAVGVNLLMLSLVLPMFNQFLSRKIISKEVQKKNGNQKFEIQDNVAFGSKQKNDMENFLAQSLNKMNKNSAKKLSFGSLKDFVDFKNLFNFKKMAEEAQSNVTSSMLLLDYGISGSRITFVPRDNNERIEYIVKEGGIILFFYYAADWIKKGFSTLANKVFKTPIDLDYKIITDKNFVQTLKNPHKKDELLKFVELAEKDEQEELKVIKFIDKELAKVKGAIVKNSVFDNFTLQMAQKEGLIDVEYDSELKRWIRHSKKYIETDKLVELNNNLRNFYDNAFKGESEKGLKNIESIIAKTKQAKALSVIGNIAICCASLSYFLPKIQYKIREHRTKTSQAPGIMVYQEMAEKKMI